MMEAGDVVVRIGDGRRIVLPSLVCDELGVREGDELVLVRQAKEIRLATREQRMREAQAFFRSVLDPERVLSDEVIAERRAEAARVE